MMASTRNSEGAVVLPEMRLPDGTSYRWQKRVNGSYLVLKTEGGTRQHIELESRKEAVEMAKSLRRVGGKHPFKTVTQLVAQSFPLVMEVYRTKSVMTTGGPGTAFNCPYEKTIDLLVHADDEASLRENFRMWGVGWSEKRDPVEVVIPRPLEQKTVDQTLKNFRVDIKGLHQRIKSRFPWLLD